MSGPTTMADLRARIDTGWEALQAAIAKLPGDRREAPGPDGWSPKDQIAHIRDWERTIMALLEGRSRAAAVGLSDDEWAMDFDRVNELLRQRSAGALATEVLDSSAQSHEELMEAIARLGDADLTRPYRSFLPNQPGNRGDNAVIDWLVGDTYEHYDEHRATLTAASGGGASW